MGVHYRRKRFFGILFALLIVGLLFWFFSPEQVVSVLGVENALFILFVLGIVGAFFPWVAPSFITLLVALVIGGVHPLFVGVVGGFGIAVGDILFYLLGFSARQLIPSRWDKKLKRLERWSNSHKKWLPLLVFLYLGFTPFPNEFLLLFLLSIRYPKKYVYSLLLAGDLLYGVLFSYLAFLY